MIILFCTMCFSSSSQQFVFVQKARTEQAFIDASFDLAEKESQHITEALDALVDPNNGSVLDPGGQFSILHYHFHSKPNQTPEDMVRNVYFLLMSAMRGTPEALYAVSQHLTREEIKALYQKDPYKAANAKEVALEKLYQIFSAYSSKQNLEVPTEKISNRPSTLDSSEKIFLQDPDLKGFPLSSGIAEQRSAKVDHDDKETNSNPPSSEESSVSESD